MAPIVVQSATVKRVQRRCSRSTCQGIATATLTYVYAESTVVLGPLAPKATPGAHDLCHNHAVTTTAPRGWEMIALPDLDTPPLPEPDDLLALADAVREIGMRCDDPVPAGGASGDSVVVLAERRHLRVIADPTRR